MNQTNRVCLSLAGYEPVRQEYFLSCRSGVLAKCVQRSGFLLRQEIFFFPERRGEPEDRDEGLDFAGALGQALIFCRDAHRSADQGAVLVDATAPVCLQCRTGMVLKLRDQPVDVLIGPMVEQMGGGQLREGCFHCSGLFERPLFDALAVIRRQAGESFSEGLDIEEGDGKGADATAGAAEFAGNFTQQGGGGPLEPVIGFSIERRRVGWSSCHGGLFYLDGKIDDEIALG